MISKRTKNALAKAKLEGTKLGNPRIEQARPLALAALRVRRPAPEVMSLMREWRARQDAPGNHGRTEPAQYLSRARPPVVRGQRAKLA